MPTALRVANARGQREKGGEMGREERGGFGGEGDGGLRYFKAPPPIFGWHPVNLSPAPPNLNLGLESPSLQEDAQLKNVLS
jgi:hypothetical protein